MELLTIKNHRHITLKSKYKNIMIGTAIACVIFIIIASITIINRANAKKENISTHITQLKQQLVLQHNNYLQLQQESQALVLLSKALKRKKTMFSDPKKISITFDRITQLAEKNGLRVSRFKPNPSSPEFFYTKTSAEITTVGRFSDTARFTQQLSTQDFLNNMIDVQINPQPGPNRTIIMKLQFEIYSAQKEEGK